MVAACAGMRDRSVDAIIANVLPIALAIVAILAGFITTAQSLLLVLLDAPVMARLRASGHYEVLIGYFRGVGRSLAWFLVLAMAILIAHACEARLVFYNRLVPALLAGLFVWTCASGLRMNHLMFTILIKKDSLPRAR